MLSFINLPWGHVSSNTKCGPVRFNRFDVHVYKQTDRQADKQSIYIYLPVFGWYINNQIFINPPMFRTLPSN